MPEVINLNQSGPAVPTPPKVVQAFIPPITWAIILGALVVAVCRKVGAK